MNWVKEQGLKPVRVWLLVVAVMIVGMVVLGGLTRLTDSGLSMVEWRVVMGAIPPLSDADWQETFDKYKQFPQYQKHFPDMEMKQFKFIFLMEYAHRLLGRLIGLVFFLPFVFFLLKKWLYQPFIWRGSLLFILGGLQGVVGWIMVKSGLVDEPRVDHLRLTLHLGLALFVLGLTFWYYLRLTHPLSKDHTQTVFPKYHGARWLVSLISMQILSGGMVAGLKAGFAFNTWPTMNGAMMPKSMWAYDSFTQNFFENPVFVQFFHRWFAILVAIYCLVFGLLNWAKPLPMLLKRARVALVVLVVIQVLLGIGTLVMRVPVSLASLHQFGAVLLLLTAVIFCQQTYEAKLLRKAPKPDPGDA